MDTEAANANALAPRDVQHFEQTVRDKEEFINIRGWSDDRYVASCYGKSGGACWYGNARNGRPRPKLEGDDE